MCLHIGSVVFFNIMPWSRVLEKLIVSQLTEEFSALYGTWSFVTTRTRASHFVSYARYV